VRKGQADHRGVSNVAGKLGKGSSNQTVATLWSVSDLLYAYVHVHCTRFPPCTALS